MNETPIYILPDSTVTGDYAEYVSRWQQEAYQREEARHTVSPSPWPWRTFQAPTKTSSGTL